MTFPTEVAVLIALTREVSPSLGRCELTHLTRMAIDVSLAKKQHDGYEECLRRLGCLVKHLPAEPELPDAVFVEDTCIVLEELAVIARPGAASRRPETESAADVIKAFRPVSRIEPPG